ncbi:MAG: putative Mg2+ transporter-C (MgtC) family protein [Frankiaceae bacterium]|nr:putative Mg2+ transporter-C (MgtC) family protein [Frankiaceae bacterium]
MKATDIDLIYRVLVGLALAFAVGFERELRGSPAGDRTFSLIGTASAAVAAVTGATSPQALAGIITGVGFIGGGLILKGRDDTVHGVTTAATVFAVAGVGLVVGMGHLVVGTLVGLTTILILELKYMPGLRILDAGRYSYRFRSDVESGPPSTGK